LSGPIADVCLVTEGYPFAGDTAAVSGWVGDLVATLGGTRFRIVCASALAAGSPPSATAAADVLPRATRHVLPANAGPALFCPILPPDEGAPVAGTGLEGGRATSGADLGRALLLAAADGGDRNVARGVARRLALAAVPFARVYHAVGGAAAVTVAAAAALATSRPLVVTPSGLGPRGVAAPGAARRDGGEIGPGGPADGHPGRASAEDPGLAAGLRIGLERAAACLAPDEALRRRAVAAGAPAESARVLPFGVDVEACARRPRGGARSATTVALIADIVPDEDVATFLRGARILIERLDLVDLYALGATDRDPAYLRYCARLAQTLGLVRLVRFVGPVDPAEIFGALDCLVLAGADDRLPPVAVEALAMGIPIVSSDLSGARDVVAGRLPEDRALGWAGRLFAFGDADDLAAAVVASAGDAAARRRMEAVARLRARRFYDRPTLLGEVADLYEALAARPAGERWSA